MIPAWMIPGANGSLGVSSCSGSPQPASGRGSVQPTSRPSVVVVPKRESAGGSSANVEKATTQPTCASRVHSGVCAKSPPRSWPFATSTSPPSRRPETSSRACAGFCLDLAAEQPAEHEGPLRVADDHDAAPVVVLREVLAPRLDHVGVGELAVRARGARHAPAERGQRALPVDRREHAAFQVRSEPPGTSRSIRAPGRGTCPRSASRRSRRSDRRRSSRSRGRRARASRPRPAPPGAGPSCRWGSRTGCRRRPACTARRPPRPPPPAPPQAPRKRDPDHHATPPHRARSLTDQPRD